MITVLDHPLVHHHLSVLRDASSDIAHFKSSASIISYFLAIEAMKELELDTITVRTTLESTTGFKIKNNIIIVPILKSGQIMMNSFIELFPSSLLGFIGINPEQSDAEPDLSYFSIPVLDESSKIILIDLLIATGKTISSALSRLQLEGAESITVASIIASPDGIEKLRTEYPGVRIITAALDKGVNDDGLLVPGIGIPIEKLFDIF
jgi:uracil phosphoribosyltransferase